MDIYEFIRTQNVNVLLEIGCHFGEDTKRFRDMLPTCHIFAFEADPRNVKIIRESKLDSLCHFYPFAVSNKNGLHDFYMSSGKCPVYIDSQHSENDWSSSSSLKKPTGHLDVHPWISFNEKVEVKCVKLDDFLPLQDVTIDFMWVDVQGAEDLVFGGALDMLKRTRYVYTEYENGLYEGQMDREEILKHFGPVWSVVHDFGNNLLLKNNFFDVNGTYVHKQEQECFYINLDSRLDRKILFEKEFENMSLKPKRFSGIPHEFGLVGCGLSHLKLLQYAKNKNLSSIIIFEDDFKFIITNEELNFILQNLPPDFDVIMLSYNLIKEGKDYNEHFGLCQEVQTASGYIVNSKFYDKLIHNLQSSIEILSSDYSKHDTYANDQYWKVLQPTSKWYYCKKRVGYQRANWSDIVKGFVDYKV